VILGSYIKITPRPSLINLWMPQKPGLLNFFLNFDEVKKGTNLKNTLESRNILISKDVRISG
jgi:hypothetical protein